MMASPDHSVTMKLKINKKIKEMNINPFQKPQEIGFYSVDGEFHDNKHLLKNIYKPESGWNAKLSEYWNLKCSSQDIKFDDSENSKHDTYNLEWILRHRDEVKSVFMTPTRNDEKIDFICNRNVLKNMCLTLRTTHLTYDGWSFYACKFNSTIYMRPIKTDLPKEEKKKETNKSGVPFGDVFEKYMTRSNKDEKIAPVNKNEGFYTMLKGQLDDHTLLYSAEIDGKDPAIRSSSTDCYIELKLGKENLEPAKNLNSDFYSQKLEYWWLQAVLGGIPKIIYGISDNNGIVKELQTFHVSMDRESATKRKSETKEESGKRQKNGEHEWTKIKKRKKKTNDKDKVIFSDNSKESCLKVCAKILGFVKECVQEDKQGIVYKFWHEVKAEEVVCKKLKDSVKYEKILPKSYTGQQ